MMMFHSFQNSQSAPTTKSLKPKHPINPSYYSIFLFQLTANYAVTVLAKILLPSPLARASSSPKITCSQTNGQNLENTFWYPTIRLLPAPHHDSDFGGSDKAICLSYRKPLGHLKQSKWVARYLPFPLFIGSYQVVVHRNGKFKSQIPWNLTSTYSNLRIRLRSKHSLKKKSAPLSYSESLLGFYHFR